MEFQLRLRLRAKSVNSWKRAGKGKIESKYNKVLCTCYIPKTAQMNESEQESDIKKAKNLKLWSEQ
jgi:hypothetical protein